MSEDSNGTLNQTGITETSFSETKTESSLFSNNEESLVLTEDSETTIRRVLSSYEIGPKLRQLRLRKKIALIDLGKHTGLSASMLSQLENGKLLPTLATLARIAMVFDVGLDYFFADKRRHRPFVVIRASERIRFPDRSTSPKPDYFFECLAFSTQGKSVQAYLAEFPERAPSDVAEHFHEGSEFIYVLEGSLEIHYQGEDYTLEAGDTVYFDSSEAHSYRGLGPLDARALVITAPLRP